MEDTAIIDLYFAREERAISETGRKYGAYCRAIAFNILHSHEDTEECVSNTWLRTWNAIPPTRPNCLRAFLGRITRNLSFTRWEAQTAQKRGGSVVAVSLDELAECLPGGESPADRAEAEALRSALSAFLRTLPERQRQVFLARYFYALPLSDIAARFSMRENTVKTTLHRTRRRLRDYLEQEELL